MSSNINEDALRHLACPVCEDRPSILLNEAKDRLICRQCKGEYQIAKNGIPLLLKDDSLKE